MRRRFRPVTGRSGGVGAAVIAAMTLTFALAAAPPVRARTSHADTALEATAAADTMAAEPHHADWLVRPFAALGIDRGVHAFQLSPEGWLRTGSATVEVRLGDRRLGPWEWSAAVPGVARATTPDGALRVRLAAVALPGLLHDLDDEPFRVPRYNPRGLAPNPVLVVELEVSASSAGTDSVLAVMLWTHAGHDDEGFMGRIAGVDQLEPPTAEWDPDLSGVTSDGRLILLASTVPDGAGRVRAPDGVEQPDLVRLSYRLSAPRAIELRLPFYAVPAGAAALLASGRNEDLLSEMHAGWAERLDLGLVLPEPELTTAALASVYHIFTGSYVDSGGEMVVVGGPFLYRQVYVRDAAFVVAALDRFGFHRDARVGLDFILAQQHANGEIWSQVDQRDGTGQALWALGQHLLRTRDRAYARRCLDTVARAMSWLRGALGVRPGDPFSGLMPRATVRDNEQLDREHIVGHNLWAFAACNGAVAVASVAGKADSAAAWQELAREFGGRLDRGLDALLVSTGGLLTPALAGLQARSMVEGFYGDSGGLDWGNLQIVFPAALWDADDPRLRPILDAWCDRLQEGLFPYPAEGRSHLVHHYLTTSIAHTLLETGSAGDLEHLFAILYDGLLGHATRTWGGSEILDLQAHDVWPRRNTQPHNTFSARYLLLLREMLVHERDGTLVIGGALSPAWFREGARIALTGAATRFGWVNLELAVRDVSRGQGSHTAKVDVRLEVDARPPERGRRPGADPVIVPSAPFDELQAIRCRAPIGYRISSVLAPSSEAAPSVPEAGTDTVSLAAEVREFTLELEGRSDPRWSWAAACSRIAADD